MKIIEWVKSLFAEKPKHKGVLKYTEYKKQQALWLQQEYAKLPNSDNTSVEEFCISKYRTYLFITGRLTENLDDTITQLNYLMNPQHLAYSVYVYRNINQIMDDLLN